MGVWASRKKWLFGGDIHDPKATLGDSKNFGRKSFGLSLRSLPISGGTNRVFGRSCSCPLPKKGRFDENGEND